MPCCTAPRIHRSRVAHAAPLLSFPLLSSLRPLRSPSASDSPHQYLRLLATRKRWTSLAEEKRASTTWRSFTRVLGLVLVLVQSRPHARFTLARELVRYKILPRGESFGENQEENVWNSGRDWCSSRSYQVRFRRSTLPAERRWSENENRKRKDVNRVSNDDAQSLVGVKERWESWMNFECSCCRCYVWHVHCPWPISGGRGRRGRLEFSALSGRSWFASMRTV